MLVYERRGRTCNTETVATEKKEADDCRPQSRVCALLFYLFTVINDTIN